MSTKTHPDDPRTSLPPSVVILGNDAQLAARPATPVQLAHACLAAGYRAVVPASWGDELIASATMQALAAHDVRPAIQCACPHVARRVLAVGRDLAPYLVSLVSPPVAAARYVRRHSPLGVRVTYVGRCPGAGDDSIDARLAPEELLAQLAERGIRLLAQPLVFESVIPPDRRRHRSQPGGLPSPESLWSGERPTTVEIVSDDDLVSEIAEKVLAGTNSLLDLAPSVGCVCAGAVPGARPHHARADVVALEPPRAPAPVVDEQFAAGLEMPLPAVARSPLDIIVPMETTAEPWWGPALPLVTEPPVSIPEPEVTRRPRFTPPAVELAAASAPRRRPSGPTNRVGPASMPVASDSEGRVLPRAYVARRRSPRGGVPVVPEPRSEPHVAPPANSNSESGTPRHTAVNASSPAPPLRGGVPELSPSISSAAPAVAVVHAPAPRALDAELPIVQSVEPAPATNGRSAGPVAPALPLLVDHVRRTSERVSGGVRAVAARRPRMSLIVVVVAFVLLGVAIGYAAADRGTERTTSGEAEGRLENQRFPSAGPRAGGDGARDTGVRSGSTPERGAAAPARRPASNVRRPRPGTRGGVRTPFAGVSPGPDSAALPSADSTTRAAVQAAVRARADSLAAEREALRRELELRRARLDSIARRVQELRPEER